MHGKSIRGRFLIAGLGSIGRRHLANLLDLGVEGILGVDPDEARRRETAERFAGCSVEVFSHLGAALERGPRAAVIATPTSLHLASAVAAARKGCHLFIEKPLSHSLDGIEVLLALVEAKGLVTLVGCNMRFHPGLAKIKKLLERHAVGRIVAIKLEFGQYLPDWHPTEDYRRGYSARQDLGGGAILDCIHEIDLARWLGGEVTAVVCFADRISGLEIETEDTAAILLRFAGGAVGEVHLDYVQRAYSRSCRILGDEGTVCWEFGKEVRLYSAGAKQWQEWSEPDGWTANQMYVEEMAHFLRCLDGGEQAALDVRQAAEVLKIALAAKTSAAKGEVERLVAIRKGE